MPGTEEKNALIDTLSPIIIKEENISCFLCNKVLEKRIININSKKHSQNICVDCIDIYIKS